MANAIRGEADLKVGDRTLRLAFDWNAAAEFEDPAGRPLSECLVDISRGKLSAKALRAMLWAGLQKHHRLEGDVPEFSLQKAGDVIAQVGRKEAMRIMGVALRYYFPELEKTEGGEAGSAGGGPPPGAAAPGVPGPSSPSQG